MGDSIRFYFDQHVPSAVAQGLSQRGIDVLTAQAAGRCGQEDTDQLQFATAERRVLTSFDADFLTLAATGLSHAGIAWCRATKYSIGELIHVLLMLHGVLDQNAMQNHVEYL